MKKVHFIFIVFIFISLFSMADTESQTTLAKIPGDTARKTQIAIDSITIYSRKIDSNQAFIESRLRSYIKRIAARTTNADTSKMIITIISKPK